MSVVEYLYTVKICLYQDTFWFYIYKHVFETGFLSNCFNRVEQSTARQETIGGNSGGRERKRRKRRKLCSGILPTDSEQVGHAVLRKDKSHVAGHR